MQFYGPFYEVAVCNYTLTPWENCWGFKWVFHGFLWLLTAQLRKLKSFGPENFGFTLQNSQFFHRKSVLRIKSTRNPLKNRSTTDIKRAISHLTPLTLKKNQLQKCKRHGTLRNSTRSNCWQFNYFFSNFPHSTIIAVFPFLAHQPFRFSSNKNLFFLVSLLHCCLLF